MPNAADLKGPQAEIKELFKSELAAAKSGAQLTELAERMLANIQDDESSQAANYALLVQAQSVAIKASNIALTRRIVSRLAMTYEVDEHQLAAQAIKDLSKGPVDQSFHHELALLALQQASDAQAADRLNAVSGYLETVSSLATKLKSTDLAKKAAAGRADLTELKKLTEKMSAASKTLAMNDKDPAANAVVGRYRLLAQRDWSQALFHLAQCDDAALKTAADADLQAISAPEPIAADEAVALATNWWDLSAKQSAPGLKTMFKHRASQWYDFALPNLKALAKTKVEQRLAESDWKPELVSPTKAPLNINIEALQNEIAAAHGLMSNDFALCQTMKFDAALALTKKLATRQFRPIRFRPYSTNDGFQVAAIWIRDAAAGDIFIGSADEILRRVDTNREAGFIAVDVAGFMTPKDSSAKHVLLSAKQQLPKGVERKVVVEYVSKGEVEYCKQMNVVPETFQRYVHSNGTLSSDMVVTSRDSRLWSLRAGPLDWVLGQMKPTLGIALDTAAFDQGAGEVQILGVFMRDNSRSNQVGHSNDLAENVAAWKKLAQNGSRPVGIGVCMTDNGSYHSMWVWHRQQ